MEMAKACNSDRSNDSKGDSIGDRKALAEGIVEATVTISVLRIVIVQAAVTETAVADVTFS